MRKRETAPKFYVYYLADPTTNVVRYVGYSNDTARRYRGHLRDSKDTRRADWDSHKCCWIRSLLNVGLKPRLLIACVLQTSDEAQRIEIAMIAVLNRRGFDLTNGTVGGDGGSQGPQARVKMRLAKLGKKQKQEHIDARREANRIGARRRFEDPEQRVKQADITRAQWADPKAREKKVLAIQAANLRRTPEQRKETGRIMGLASQAARRKKKTDRLNETPDFDFDG